MMRTLRAKRAVDVTGAAVGLVMSAPLLVALAVAIRVNMGRPILFRQIRPGLHGLPFTLLKFRTMRAPAYPAEPDADRLTTLGRWLRRSSLDELPELVNVLRGDMSLVGPRPLLMDYLERYSPAQARRHEVRPGITGLAQVEGRNLVAWEDRLALDVWYVDHLSLWEDVRIIGRTVATVLSGVGVSADDHATMAPFQGSRAMASEARR